MTTLPVPPAVKPGWKTSEFWLAVVSVPMATAAVAILNSLIPVSAQINPMLGMVASLAIPAAVAWVTGKYITGRSAVKAAPLVTDLKTAVSVLRQGP